MNPSAEESALQDRFAESYQRGRTAVMQTIERAVCGCAYGGTSYATRQEADDVGAMLALRPGRRLLEVGAGSGWPALYLAGQSGCDVTLADLPLDGIRIAARRAVVDRLPGACLAVVADAAHLPFRDGCFDVINHSDVLCCLVRKREVLAECQRVIRPGGWMAFSVIYLPPGLSAANHARAVETAPEFAESDADYPTLLAETGWGMLERHDLTGDFMANCIQKLHAEEDLRAELEPLTGAADFDARHARLRRRIAVLEQRDLRRELFIVEPAE